MTRLDAGNCLKSRQFRNEEIQPRRGLRLQKARTLQKTGLKSEASRSAGMRTGHRLNHCPKVTARRRREVTRLDAGNCLKSKQTSNEEMQPRHGLRLQKARTLKKTGLKFDASRSAVMRTGQHCLQPYNKSTDFMLVSEKGRNGLHQRFSFLSGMHRIDEGNWYIKLVDITLSHQLFIIAGVKGRFMQANKPAKITAMQHTFVPHCLSQS